MPEMSASPAELILSIGGVDFALTPANNDAEISYQKNGQGVRLSLNSFTGTLQVALKGGGQRQLSSTVSSATATTTTTTATVEEEPHSPEIAPKFPNVSPGQQQLPFSKTTAKEPTKTLTKKTKGKRSVTADAKQAKKSRREEPKQVESNNNSVAPDFPSLCQTMNGSTQPTQAAMPDLSQTMPSASLSFKSGSDVDTFQGQDPSNTAVSTSDKPKPSVQEILDRANSNDSVATVQDDNDDDDDQNSVATNVVVEAAGKPSSVILVEEKMEEDQVLVGAAAAGEASSAVVVPATTLENTSSSSLVVPQGSYPSPCPRWGHTMTQIKGEKMLVYGGQSFDLQGNPTILNDVHVYDIQQRKWSKPINCRGEARQWHSATLLPERQLVIAFGGETVDSVKNKDKLITSDTLRVLDTDIMLWYPPAVSGDIPTGRSGHTATLLPHTNELVLFGGNKGSKWLNTVHILDTVRWIWSSPKVHGTAPKPRSYHTATAVKGKDSTYKLVIFGGNNKTKCFNTVHVLEAKDNVWTWSHPEVTGQAPFPRTGHSATLVDESKICIYGGWDPNEEDASTGQENIFKSSFMLDTETWTWGNGPKAVPGGSGSEGIFVADCGPKRCGHTTALNPENGELMIFGGRIPGEVVAGDFQKLAIAEQPVEIK